jgi:hypothetical protein
MALDYYPGISAARDGGGDRRGPLNMQVQASMVIATPLFVGMIVFGGPLLDFLLHRRVSGRHRGFHGMDDRQCRLPDHQLAGRLLGLSPRRPRRNICLSEGPAALLAPLVTIAPVAVGGTGRRRDRGGALSPRPMRWSSSRSCVVAAAWATPRPRGGGQPRAR